MNKVILAGRLTKDPETYHGEDGSITAVRYTLAVERKAYQGSSDNKQTADYISCSVFGRSAEFADHNFCKGIKVIISGKLQSGSYINKSGQKVFTTEVIVEEQEFAESKEVNEKYIAKSWSESELQEKKSNKKKTEV